MTEQREKAAAEPRLMDWHDATDKERAWRLAYCDAIERWLKAEQEIEEMKKNGRPLYDFECKVLLLMFGILALVGIAMIIHAVLL